jgi:hypothetical protein
VPGVLPQAASSAPHARNAHPEVTCRMSRV